MADPRMASATFAELLDSARALRTAIDHARTCAESDDPAFAAVRDAALANACAFAAAISGALDELRSESARILDAPPND